MGGMMFWVQRDEEATGVCRGGGKNCHNSNNDDNALKLYIRFSLLLLSFHIIQPHTKVAHECNI